ncbi:hypothetical protein O1L60_13130 [Streptomyces diastatochromogenes]|nr:hypothetical protein [Streptomyces diastatochromogenes]
MSEAKDRADALSATALLNCLIREVAHPGPNADAAAAMKADPTVNADPTVAVDPDPTVDPAPDPTVDADPDPAMDPDPDPTMAIDRITSSTSSRDRSAAAGAGRSVARRALCPYRGRLAPADLRGARGADGRRAGPAYRSHEQDGRR